MPVTVPKLIIHHLPLPGNGSVHLDVLRLDLVHPVISGNKWFKLKNYIQEAITTKKETLLTFGGAYSNHIVATAAAAQTAGLKSIGIIRGEEPSVWSHTLKAAQQYGMQLFFVSRSDYREKKIPASIFGDHDAQRVLIIPEGGYSVKGAEGIATLFDEKQFSQYSHFITAVGTGTTLAGLVKSALPHQMAIGIPVLKNAFSLQKEIAALLPKEKQDRFQLMNEYHFGGYAKYTSELIQFMNSIFGNYALPTDFVYTAKALYATTDLVAKDYFAAGSKIIFLHTGGLQGNASLPKGTLIFEA